MEKLLARIAALFPGQQVRDLHFDQETEVYTVYIDNCFYEAWVYSDDDGSLFFRCEALNSSFDVDYTDCFEDE